MNRHQPHNLSRYFPPARGLAAGTVRRHALFLLGLLFLATFAYAQQIGRAHV